MQKRRASDSGCQSEQKKHLTEKEKHAENILDASKTNTGSGMEIKLTIRTLLIDQDYTSGSTSYLSSFAEKGSLRKITDETSVDNNFTSADKENSSSMGDACGNSDDVSSNSVGVVSISNRHAASETKGNKIVGCHYKLDSNDPSAITNPSLSGAVKSDLAGVEDRYMATSLNDTSNNESNISFHVASCCEAEKEPDTDLSFPSCDIKVVLKDSFDARLQVTVGSITGNSVNEFEAVEVQKLRIKDVNDVIHETNGSSNEIAPESKDLPDESGKMPEACDISAEGNMKELSAECREHPSPIRGVVHYPTSLKEPIEGNSLNSSRKEEICFSFQTMEKFLIDNQSVKASSAVESNKVFPTIGKNDDSKSMSSCIVSGITDGLRNKEDVILMSHSTGNGLTSDAVDFQDKSLEAVIVEPERSIVNRRRKLLVLDLNGLLADIFLDIRNVHRGRKKVGGKIVFRRPFCDDFLKFCFEKFDIGIWSSRRKYNVDSALDYLMGESRHKLLFCWDQSHCTYTGFKAPDNVHKPLVLKEMKRLWNKEVTDLPWEMGDYSPSNTLLVDDSPYKALCNPPNSAIFPYPYRFDNENDTSLGPGGDLRVYLEGLYEADDVRLYVQQHPFGQQSITNSDSSWNFYLQVIEKVEQSLVPAQ